MPEIHWRVEYIFFLSTLCMLGNFSCFFLRLLTCFRIIFFQKNCSGMLCQSIKWFGSGLDQVPNCLGKLTADETSRILRGEISIVYN